MALADITDPQAVRMALDEFDALGRDVFLRRYGFGSARRYLVVHEDRRYDSKAIAGVAHGCQFPALGPLRASDFSGGESTVANKLRSLGFEVLVLDGASAPRTWVFCANPSRYRIMDAVAHLQDDYWTIGRSNVRAGDRAAIWQTLDKKGRRGIVAFGDVLSDPENRTEINPYWTDPTDGLVSKARVRVAYSVPQGLPLWVDDSDVGTFLRSLSVARSQGGTVFHVETEQWERLVSMGEYRSIASEALEAEQLVRNRGSGGAGQGFGLTGPERRAVEDHAMALATSYFSVDWECVDDVSSRCSYDLLCRRQDTELRVEVKGTTTAGHDIVLTRKEVDEAQGDDYCLFVVSEIVLDRSKKEPAASGGVARCYCPWAPTADALQPISYICSIDHSAGAVVGALSPSSQ